jgi:hypothetical protein
LPSELRKGARSLGFEPSVTDGGLKQR